MKIETNHVEKIFVNVELPYYCKNGINKFYKVLNEKYSIEVILDKYCPKIEKKYTSLLPLGNLEISEEGEFVIKHNECLSAINQPAL